MKTYILSATLLVNIITGASDSVGAPTYLSHLRQQQQQNNRRVIKKQQPKKKFPLWLKIGIGVGVVTTTAIIGGIIWNKYHGLQFDGPYSYCAATAMNFGVVLGKLGFSNDRFRNLALRGYGHTITCLLLGASNAIFCVHQFPKSKSFYRTFNYAFYSNLMVYNKVSPTAN